jgi:hypothetical protein
MLSILVSRNETELDVLPDSDEEPAEHHDVETDIETDIESDAASTEDELNDRCCLVAGRVV